MDRFLNETLEFHPEPVPPWRLPENAIDLSGYPSIAANRLPVDDPVVDEPPVENMLVGNKGVGSDGGGDADHTTGKGQARDDGKGKDSDDGWGATAWSTGDDWSSSSSEGTSWRWNWHSSSWQTSTPYGRIRTGEYGGRVRVGDSGGANPEYYRQFYIAKGKGRVAMNSFLSEFGPPPSRGGKGFHKRQY